MKTLSLICILIVALLTGCAPKVANLTLVNPQMLPVENKHISTYDSKNDLITFYHFYTKEGKLVVEEWSKILPHRVEYMNLWITGLGHDLERLTHKNANTIENALMYGARQQGMRSLHLGQNDYILDNSFAQEMVDVITAYEEKMKRYEKDLDFPLPMK